MSRIKIYDAMAGLLGIKEDHVTRLVVDIGFEDAPTVTLTRLIDTAGDWEHIEQQFRIVEMHDGEEEVPDRLQQDGDDSENISVCY